MSRLNVIEVESHAKCEFCGKVDELRPYGPRGERICFDCAIKDEKTMEHQCSRYIFGEDVN